jgi:hypothetical protein
VVATSRETTELTALLETRAQLEAALAGDENWRALQQAARREGGEEGAARRARNTRLKMALAENPLYQAWKHVGEAVEALRAAAASAPRLRPGSLAARLAAGVSLAAEAEEQAPEPGQAAGGGAAVPSPQPQAPSAASRAQFPAPQPPRRIDVEPEEATVTFVRRSPGNVSSSAAPRHQPDHAVEPGARQAPFTPPVANRDEAEVVIVPDESAGAQGGSEPPPHAPRERKAPQAK